MIKIKYDMPLEFISCFCEGSIVGTAEISDEIYEEFYALYDKLKNHETLESEEWDRYEQLCERITARGDFKVGNAYDINDTGDLMFDEFSFEVLK